MSCDVLPAWVSLLPLSSWLPFITLFCTLFMAHLGYLHLTKASLRCCNSSLRSSSVVQTILALRVSVPMRVSCNIMNTTPQHTALLCTDNSVISTLTHRAKTVCTTLELLNEKLQHCKEALVRCKYPRWAINKVQNKVINCSWEDSDNT